MGEETKNNSKAKKPIKYRLLHNSHLPNEREPFVIKALKSYPLLILDPHEKAFLKICLSSSEIDMLLIFLGTKVKCPQRRNDYQEEMTTKVEYPLW